MEGSSLGILIIFAGAGKGTSDVTGRNTGTNRYHL
jgi:hypothetical protein